jgi:hypothetical protein
LEQIFKPEIIGVSGFHPQQPERASGKLIDNPAEEGPITGK